MYKLVKLNKKSHVNDFIKIFIFLTLVIIFFKLLQYFFNKKNIEPYDNPKKYNIAIMTIFKNEQNYMEEWLNYHIDQGIEQIFMYCNDQNIHNYLYLLDPKYKNYITIIDWTKKENNGLSTIQRQAYTHCTKTYGNQCQFLLMLDLDEFLIHTNKHNTVAEYIHSLKLDWTITKAFKIQRYNFGSNGHKTKPIGSIMNNYTHHEKICSSYKTMANTDFVNKDADFFGVHDFNFLNKDGKIYNDYFGYHETGYPNSCKQDSINEIPLVINHYYTKSYEEYLARCILWENGGINPINYRTDCINKFKARDINEVKDYN